MAQFVDDGLADLHHHLFAAGEAALVGALEDGDDVGDIVVVAALGPLYEGEAVEQAQQVVGQGIGLEVVGARPSALSSSSRPRW